MHIANRTNSMLSKVTMTKTIATRFAALGLFSGLLLGLSGCPLQTAAVEVGIGVSGDITVVASAGSPAVGQTLTLTAQAPASAMVSFIGATWTSSNPAVVEITSSAGASASAVARKAGAATITVRASGKAGSRTINVLESVGSVMVDGKTSLDFGDESEYVATVTDKSGKPISTAVVSWSASGKLELVGTAVSGAKMKFRAKGVGTGAVTAQAGGQTAQVIVNIAPGKAKLAVAQSDGTAFPAMIAAGQSVVARAQFELNTLKDPATEGRWSVTGGCSLSSTTGATVQITGSASGTCMVTATANGLTAMASFTVITVTAVKITGDVTGALKLGATRMLTAVAQSDGKDVTSVPVTWTQTNGAVALSTTGNVVTATGVGVGSAMLRASVGAIAQTATFAVEPQALEIKVGVDVTTTVPVLAGGGATVTVTPKGNAGVIGKFITVDGVALTGATGFTTVGPATLGAQGLVTFALTGATAASPAVKATFGAVQSNAIAFTITTIKTVTVTGPTADVRVGEALDLMVVVKDADGKTIPEGGVPVSWADPTGVLTVPAMTDGFSVSANVVKLGMSGLVATVKGVASATYVVTGVPGMVTMTEFSPRTVPVGGTATATVSVLDVQGRVITGVPAAQVVATSTDATKVSVAAPVAAGNVFTVTATGVALAPAPGAGVTVKWDSGTSNVTGDTRQLIVAAGQVAWEGACVATPVGPKTWRVSGFQGATSGGNAIVYDIYAALGAAAMTNSSKVASDGVSGVAKDVAVASVAGDWNFGVVARASDGATSGVVACTRGVTVSHTAVASSAIVLGAGGSAVYADDVASAVGATNPRPLFVAAGSSGAAALTLDRTAPRASASFGGGLVGIGVSAGGAQILYKRPATGAGADGYGVPAMLAAAKTDSSGGVCKSRAGITAFELAGKATAASALSSFAVFTSTGTATSEAADCALNVLAFREGATKTIASGVDRAAPFGDHRLGYTFGGALFDVDLTTGSKLPRLLADDGIAAGSLIAAVNPTTGTAGAIEASSIYVLSPTGVLSRYAVGAPPLAAVASPVTAALVGADGLVAVDADTLFVTVGGVLKVIEVTGAGPLTVTVTARDYATFGAFPVTLGSSTAAAQ
jgi:hypothetical protein